MAARKPKVIVTRKLPDPVETRMRELFDTELNLTDQPMDRAALEAAVARADVLAPTITDKIDAALLDQAGPQLKLIANFGAGVDHIDVTAATARGITVTNTPGVLAEDTADLTLALSVGKLTKVDLDRWNHYGYHDAYSHSEGQVSLDAFDSKTKRAVWHGQVTDAINPTKPDAGKLQVAVDQLLEKFPAH